MAAASSASGVTTAETTGIATALASGPTTDTCANRNSAAGARPSVIAHCTCNHCFVMVWFSFATKNMRATAPKDSQKPGASTAQGSKASTTPSASASTRSGAAMRPDHKASATMVTIQNVRCAGTAKPATSV